MKVSCWLCFTRAGGFSVLCSTTRRDRPRGATSSSSHAIAAIPGHLVIVGQLQPQAQLCSTGSRGRRGTGPVLQEPSCKLNGPHRSTPSPASPCHRNGGSLPGRNQSQTIHRKPHPWACKAYPLLSEPKVVRGVPVCSAAPPLQGHSPLLHPAALTMSSNSSRMIGVPLHPIAAT